MDNSNAQSIDSILQLITTSSNPEYIDQHLRNIKPREARDLLLASPLPDGQDPLSVLDPQVNTLGMLYILVARLNSQSPPPQVALRNFCQYFDPRQVDVSPHLLMAFGKGIVSTSTQHGQPELAIPLLYILLLRYRPLEGHLTTLHTDFAMLCVKTGRYGTALPVISQPITSVSLELCPELSYNDNLIYHYTSGIAFSALKQWNNAEEAFEICVTSPAVGYPAALQLEALKKLKLVQLISKGKTSALPKYTQALLIRMYSHSPYYTLSGLYPDKLDQMQDLVTKEKALFTEEKNLGLVQLALARVPRWTLKKLTATYVTLGLAEIGKAIKIEDIEEVRALILEMIESSDISAQISADGTVVFSDPLPVFTKQDVDEVLRLAHEQQATLAGVDAELLRSKEFLAKAVSSASKARDEWGVAGGDPMELNLNQFNPGGRPSWAVETEFDLS